MLLSNIELIQVTPKSKEIRLRDSLKASGDALSSAGHHSFTVCRNGNNQIPPVGTDENQYSLKMKKYLFSSMTATPWDGEQMEVMNCATGEEPNADVRIQNRYACEHVHNHRERPA